MSAPVPVPLSVSDLRAASDLLPVPVCLLGPDGEIRWVNATWAAVQGRMPGPGELLVDLLHPADAARLPEPGRAERVRLGTPGAFRAVQLSAQALPDGLLVTAVDVHDLTEQRDQLQGVVDANADCIKVLSLDARLLSMNVGGMKVMEVDDMQACLNAAWPTFWEGETRPHVDAALDAARAGQTAQFEGFCPTMKGTPKWWEVTLSPIRDATGSVVNLLATSRDITARKRAEQDLLTLNASLEERVQARTEELSRTVEALRRSNAELERFAYIAAHDLQEPIRTVHSFTDMLGQRYLGTLDERGQQYLGFITQGAARMKALVDDLLAYARLTDRRPVLAPVPAGVPVREALNRLDALLHSRHAQVQIADLPSVHGEAAQLTQVFQNLIGNAVKFTHADRTPHVLVNARPATPDDGEAGPWVFSVCDNGIGIDEAYRDRIFQLFQRLHTRDDYEGTGLGLAICQKIIAAHGGRIWVDAAPEGGSCFHFTLPGAPDPAAPEPGPA